MNSVHDGEPDLAQDNGGSEVGDLPLTMTVPEVARTLRVSRGAAYEAVRTGQIPVVRIGRSLRVPRHVLARLLGARDGDA